MDNNFKKKKLRHEKADNHFMSLYKTFKKTSERDCYKKRFGVDHPGKTGFF